VNKSRGNFVLSYYLRPFQNHYLDESYIDELQPDPLSVNEPQPGPSSVSPTGKEGGGKRSMKGLKLFTEGDVSQSDEIYSKVNKSRGNFVLSHLRPFQIIT
jgi:hypothetical protein